jgi:hypothetical protein
MHLRKEGLQPVHPRDAVIAIVTSILLIGGVAIVSLRTGTHAAIPTAFKAGMLAFIYMDSVSVASGPIRDSLHHMEAWSVSGGSYPVHRKQTDPD